MKARVLLDGAALGPECISKVIGQAFDEAWVDIGGNYRSDVVREGDRLRLANALLSIAKDNDDLEVATLKKAAIEAMEARRLTSNLHEVHQKAF
jgi:hypothetical protein